MDNELREKYENKAMDRDDLVAALKDNVRTNQEIITDAATDIAELHAFIYGLINAHYSGDTDEMELRIEEALKYLKR